MICTIPKQPRGPDRRERRAAGRAARRTKGARPPELRLEFLPDELVVDLFAGGGGASAGIEAALERPVDLAINHDPIALEVHRANHPETEHIVSNVWEVDPVKACRGRTVGLLWASPACTHFSKAKGSTNPLSAKIRSLAWVVVRWARTVAPRVIVVENVEEFAKWGPLDAHGRPNKAKAGQTFKAWCTKLRKLGYTGEFRELVAADYGTPTIRKRLFAVFRRDRQPIVWPEPTHGPGRAQPYRTAAECIDWTNKGRSIFDRKKPLKDATLRRIAAGLDRYVFAGQPFILPVTHQGDERVHGVAEPLRTVTAAHRGELALCEPTLEHRDDCPASLTPFIATYYGQSIGSGVTAPLGTVTATPHHALVSPFVVRTAHGEANAKDGRPRWGRGHQSIGEPLGTVCASGGDFALVTPFVLGCGGPSYAGKPRSPAAPLGTVLPENHRAVCTPFLLPVKSWGGGGNDPRTVKAPMRTITASKRGEFAVCAPYLIKYHGGPRGDTRCQDVGEALRTVDTSNRFALCTPFLVRHGHYSTRTGAGLYEGCGAGTFREQPLTAPMSTVCATDDRHVVVPVIVPHYGGEHGTQAPPRSVTKPLGTVTSIDHNSLVCAYVTKFYGTARHGASCNDPLPTATASAGGGHLGVVEVCGTKPEAVETHPEHREHVRAFLVKYYSGGAKKRGRKNGTRQVQGVDEPLHTATAKARFGLVQIDGQAYEIVDIRMRMLQPLELAKAMGFDDGYDFSAARTKTKCTALIGNSVCKEVVQRLIEANGGGPVGQLGLFAGAS